MVSGQPYSPRKAAFLLGPVQNMTGQNALCRRDVASETRPPGFGHGGARDLGKRDGLELRSFGLVSVGLWLGAWWCLDAWIASFRLAGPWIV